VDGIDRQHAGGIGLDGREKISRAHGLRPSDATGAV
jgi:hypothetical protein